MNILGIETSGPVCAVGIVGRDRGVLSECMVRGQKIHSVRVLALIDELLDDAGLMLKELDGVAVSAGPGSFTGLRIGLTVAKTLSQVLRIPVVGVPSLEILAYRLSGTAGLVWALIPARRGEVYAALYDCAGGYPDGVFPPASLEIDRLIEMVDETGDNGRLRFFVGEATELYSDLLHRKLGDRVRFCSPVLNNPQGAVVTELGRKLLGDGRGLDAFTLVPEYIRPPAAELVWQKKNRGGA